MKTCFKCERFLPLTEFYKHPRMKDGRLNKCKECSKKDANDHRDNNREKIAERERYRSKTEHRKGKAIQYQRNYRAVNSIKNKARRMVAKRISSGALTKMPCVFCGSNETEAHHEDYSKPLDVIWVCFKCHREKFHYQTVV